MDSAVGVVCEKIDGRKEDVRAVGAAAGPTNGGES